MKKLNRKGFTLVELLAVIIILAIVVGITIPAILTTTENAKKKAFNTAAQTSADWIERQYQLYLVDTSDTGINDTLKNTDGKYFKVTATGGYKTFSIDATTGTDSEKEIAKSLIEAAGIKPTNVSKIEVKINDSTGRVCVRLTSAASGGDYPNNETTTGGACTGVSF